MGPGVGHRQHQVILCRNLASAPSLGCSTPKIRYVLPYPLTQMVRVEAKVPQYPPLWLANQPKTPKHWRGLADLRGSNRLRSGASGTTAVASCEPQQVTDHVRTVLGFDFPFLSSIVLSKNRPFCLGFRRFSGKKDPWKEWGRTPRTVLVSSACGFIATWMLDSC